MNATAHLLRVAGPPTRQQTGQPTCRQHPLWVGTPSDFAFLASSRGGIVAGRGPFKAYRSAPRQRPALFYVNDFALSLTHPWLEPSEIFVDEFPQQEIGGTCSEPPKIEWTPLSPGQFRRAFSETQRRQASGFWEKAVLAASQRGRMKTGDIRNLRWPAHTMLKRFFGSNRPESGSPGWAYGFRLGQTGWSGVTPEQLFHCTGSRLQTMALAGSSPSASSSSLLREPKDLREHRIVADFLEERLSGLGRLQRSGCRVVEHGPVSHLRTDFDLELERCPAPDVLLRRLHPTPALGVWPRNASTMSALARLRAQTGTPRWFGAPFGVKRGSDFEAVVLIRGIFWRDSRIDLPSGCGVLSESSLSREWQELGWKRESTRRLLGLS